MIFSIKYDKNLTENRGDPGTKTQYNFRELNFIVF